ncbi:4264_t:CDS:2, partial [Ambispora leptoticha]
MVNENKPTELSSKDFAEKSLGHRFPNYTLFRNELKNRLGDVILKVVLKVVEDAEGKKVTKFDLVESKKGLTDVSSQFGGKTTSGDASKYQVMSKELTQRTDQYGKVSTFDQKSDTNITTHKG